MLNHENSVAFIPRGLQLTRFTVHSLTIFLREAHELRPRRRSSMQAHPALMQYCPQREPQAGLRPEHLCVHHKFTTIFILRQCSEDIRITHCGRHGICAFLRIRDMAWACVFHSSLSGVRRLLTANDWQAAAVL